MDSCPAGQTRSPNYCERVKWPIPRGSNSVCLLILPESQCQLASTEHPGLGSILKILYPEACIPSCPRGWRNDHCLLTTSELTIPAQVKSNSARTPLPSELSPDPLRSWGFRMVSPKLAKGVWCLTKNGPCGLIYLDAWSSGNSTI